MIHHDDLSLALQLYHRLATWKLHGWSFYDLEDQQAAMSGAAIPGGHVLHAGFFLGPRGFYAALRGLHESDRARFSMRGVAYVNQLHGPEQELKILQRRDARFVNTAMMVTLLGATVSDGLDDGRVVSGVGGQYNFVAMAHELPGARSILCLRAARSRGGSVTSNIVWSYGHCTIPRHLRDIVITEYGIADLRGRTDEECIAALLNIADSRFQESLLAQARSAGKIAAGYRIPADFRNNTPAQLERVLGTHRHAGFFSEYPFGTDLTAEEIVLARALKHLKARTATRSGRLRALAAALTRGVPDASHSAPLRRLQLDAPRRLSHRLLRRLVTVALKETAADVSPGE